MGIYRVKINIRTELESSFEVIMEADDKKEVKRLVENDFEIDLNRKVVDEFIRKLSYGEIDYISTDIEEVWEEERDEKESYYDYKVDVVD